MFEYTQAHNKFPLFNDVALWLPGVWGDTPAVAALVSTCSAPPLPPDMFDDRDAHPSPALAWDEDEEEDEVFFNDGDDDDDDDDDDEVDLDDEDDEDDEDDFFDDDEDEDEDDLDEFFDDEDDDDEELPDDDEEEEVLKAFAARIVSAA